MTWAAQDACERTLLPRLRDWARALGFSQIGVSDVDLSTAEPGLLQWLDNGFHGSMAYMAAHGLKRARPAELVPGTVRAITARMDYLPRTTPQGWQAIEWRRIGEPARAQVSLYARGRDYHKVVRARLQKLADRLADAVGPFGHRVFTDSAPVLEVELASRSGIGWRGKHTLALSRERRCSGAVGGALTPAHRQRTQRLAVHSAEARAIQAAHAGQHAQGGR